MTFTKMTIRDGNICEFQISVEFSLTSVDMSNLDFNENPIPPMKHTLFTKSRGY